MIPTTPAAGQFVEQPAFGELQTPEVAIVESARQVLDEIMAIPASEIPAALLADAEGIAIVPGLVKGGFIVGVRHGRGVVVVRNEQRAWNAPLFITITGGSIGWQAGVQATDVVLVFKTKNSVQGLMNGKFTIGGDVAAAAGPVGRQAQMATDARLQAEMYSYSRSRGLFAGVALDGAVIQVDARANAAYYNTPAGAPGQPQPLPPSAQRLLERIIRYTGGVVLAPEAPIQAVHLFPEPQPAAPGNLQQQLAESSRRLAGIVDERWRSYLALPPQVYTQHEVPREAIQQALEKFHRVALNPEYQALTQRPEFQETYQRLSEFVATQGAVPPLSLPAPPSDGG